MIRIDNTPLHTRDPNVVLPRDVKATIKRGRAEYSHATRDKSSCAKKTKASRPITAIIDPKGHRRRENHLEAKTKAAEGRRGQPPGTARLRAVMILVDDLERQGVPFATTRNSRMNKLVQAWLSKRMASSKDDRKSRRNSNITPDAVRALLKQVTKLRT